MDRPQDTFSGVVLLSFWLSGEVQLCTSFIEHLSRPEGCDLTTKGLEPYHDFCMLDVDVSKCLNC